MVYVVESNAVAIAPSFTSLYSLEQAESIRRIVSEVLAESGLTIQGAASEINIRLSMRKEEGVSFSFSYLSRMRKFGLSPDTSSLESLYRLPFLYLLSDRYSQTQMWSVVLGQDPVADPMKVQLSKNKYFLGFEELRNIFSDSQQRVDFYKGRRGFSDLYCECQIYRIRKVSSFIVNTENRGLARAVLAEKISKSAPYPCKDTNITNLVNVGSSSTNSSINVLCHLPSLARISDRFTEEDLRLVALGQTPPCMAEEELSELQEWRDRLRKVVNSTSKLELPSFLSCDPPSESLSEYLKNQFGKLNLSWKQGIQALLSHVPDPTPTELEEVEAVLRGKEKMPTNMTLDMVKWAFSELFDQDFSRKEMTDLINR